MQCPYPKCKTDVPGENSRDELKKMRDHIWKAHRVSYDLKILSAIRTKQKVEEKEGGGKIAKKKIELKDPIVMKSPVAKKSSGGKRILIIVEAGSMDQKDCIRKVAKDLGISMSRFVLTSALKAAGAKETA